MTVPLALGVIDLCVDYRVTDTAGRPGQRLQAVRGVTIRVSAGQSVGIVGESGCGKSTLGRAIGGMLPPTADPIGRLVLDGEQVRLNDPSAWDGLRGRRVVYVPQGGMGALDPVRTVATQLLEQLTVVAGLDDRTASSRVPDLLEEVGLNADMATRFPHQLSGGQRQRVALVLATAARPEVLVADEPTTGLDTEVAHTVLDVLDDLRRRRGLAMLVISHDVGLVAERCDRIAVMYAGQIVEQVDPAGPPARHPYTIALQRATPDTDPTVAWEGITGRPPDLSAPPEGCSFAPRCDLAHDRCRVEEPALVVPSRGGLPVACHLRDDRPLPTPAEVSTRARTIVDAGEHVLKMAGVSLAFATAVGTVQACVDIDLRIAAGEVVALQGPSGSGKSTLARIALGLIGPDAGTVRLAGRDLADLHGRHLRRPRQASAFVHQDAYGALHPGMRVRAVLAEALRLHRVPRAVWDARTRAALDDAGLEPDDGLLSSFPHELSGGQRQRVAIARAIVTDPSVGRGGRAHVDARRPTPCRDRRPTPSDGRRSWGRGPVDHPRPR